MNEHPFLDTSNIPDWEKLTPDHIRDDISKALENAESALEGIRQLNPTDITFANTVKALEEASHELYYAWGLVTHLDAVCNSEALREAHNEMLPQVSSFGAKITLDPKLWQALQTFAESEEATKLNPIDRRLLDETILDFREAGADLDDEKRKRLEEVSQELAQVTQKFSEQVLDATNDWQLVVREETKLKGLPSTAKEAARLTALEKLGEEKGKDAWVFTLHMPSMLPVLQYLDDEEIRQKVWAASDRLCVDEPYANEPLIRQILALRQEKAEILGKDDFADVVLSRRMARDGAKADEFVTELGQKSTRFFQEENKELEEFKSQMTGEAVDLLQPWEVGYWSEKLEEGEICF